MVPASWPFLATSLYPRGRDPLIEKQRHAKGKTKDLYAAYCPTGGCTHHPPFCIPLLPTGGCTHHLPFCIPLLPFTWLVMFMSCDMSL